MWWRWVTSWNVGFAIMSTLISFGFQGCWEQEGNAWRFFQRKNWINKCEKVDFLQIRHFLIAEMGKASSERCKKQGTYCISKTLSCNRWTTIWLRQQQKWPVKQKKLISTPDWYISLGAQPLTPQKCFSVFLFSVVFQQKISWCSNQWFCNASNCFEMT